MDGHDEDGAHDTGDHWPTGVDPGAMGAGLGMASHPDGQQQDTWRRQSVGDKVAATEYRRSLEVGPRVASLGLAPSPSKRRPRPVPSRVSPVTDGTPGAAEIGSRDRSSWLLSRLWSSLS